MKKKLVMAFSCAVLFLSGAGVRAQDSTKKTVVKQINKSSEQADNLHGKKIQQQSLSNNQFEKLDTIAGDKSVQKKHSKRKHKH